MSEKVSKDALKGMSIDEAMNLDFDSIPELGFKLWAEGTYIVIFGNPESDKVGDKDVLKVPYTLSEVVELANAGEEAPDIGTESAITYFLPLGVANLKTDFATIREALGASKPSEIMEKIPGYKAALTVGKRGDKNDKTKFYQTIISIDPAEL